MAKEKKAEESMHLGPTPKALAENVVRMLRLESAGEIHPLVLTQFLNVACFWTSNRDGKGDQCKDWSVKASAKRDEYPKNKWPPNAGLVHEHVVPRKLIIQLIKDRRVEILNAPDAASKVTRILSLSRNCIITKCEDGRLEKAKLKEKMPDGFDPDDEATHWLRYDHPEVNIARTRKGGAATA